MPGANTVTAPKEMEVDAQGADADDALFLSATSAPSAAAVAPMAALENAAPSPVDALDATADLLGSLNVATLPVVFTLTLTAMTTGAAHDLPLQASVVAMLPDATGSPSQLPVDESDHSLCWTCGHPGHFSRNCGSVT